MLGADDDAAQAKFRAVVGDWIDEVSPRMPTRRWHPRDVFTDAGSCDESERLDTACAWQRALHQRGWAAVHWPAAYGGCGLGRIESGIIEQELSRRGVPRAVFGVGIGMVGPTLIRYGTDVQRDRHLPAILRGDEIWCQLFSEPDAGSDLASMSTRAELHGDHFVVTGSKIWSSGAHHSDYGILLARTNRDAPAHQGITCFIVGMRATGVDIRPVRQLTGVAHFNAVHFDAVAVGVDAVIGEIDGGWQAAMTTLANERNVTGRITAAETIADLIDVVHSCSTTATSCTRQDLAHLYSRLVDFDCLLMRLRSAERIGRQPGPESSLLKLALSLDAEELAGTAIGLQGADGMLAGDDVWRQYFLGHLGSRIGGGTDQMQRNAIGERILGLPREPRAARAGGA
jgi:alkylation response protein AidB-like acyl-CoA dehydrogenase